jgi:uncharacterized repeat protein (TIGR04138 family)
MNGIVLDDEIMDKLRERNPQFQDAAYVFVLSALHFVIERLPEPRHITGRELVEGVRDLALDRFGPMARTVLDHWGFKKTADVGRIVFALVEAGILIKQEEDLMSDFDQVFDFDEAFGGEYPWGGKAQ